MATWADIGEWLSQAWDRIKKASSHTVEQIVTVVPSPPPVTSPPTSGGTTGGGSSTGSGTTAPGGGASPSFFGESLTFLRNISSEITWKRVGLVLLGILLIVIAVRMFLYESPTQRVMRQIGVS